MKILLGVLPKITDRGAGGTFQIKTGGPNRWAIIIQATSIIFNTPNLTNLTFVTSIRSYVLKVPCWGFGKLLFIGEFIFEEFTCFGFWSN